MNKYYLNIKNFFNGMIKGIRLKNNMIDINKSINCQETKKIALKYIRNHLEKRICSNCVAQPYSDILMVNNNLTTLIMLLIKKTHDMKIENIDLKILMELKKELRLTRGKFENILADKLKEKIFVLEDPTNTDSILKELYDCFDELEKKEIFKLNKNKDIPLKEWILDTQMLSHNSANEIINQANNVNFNFAMAVGSWVSQAMNPEVVLSDISVKESGPDGDQGHGEERI